MQYSLLNYPKSNDMACQNLRRKSTDIGSDWFSLCQHPPAAFPRADEFRNYAYVLKPRCLSHAFLKCPALYILSQHFPHTILLLRRLSLNPSVTPHDFLKMLRMLLFCVLGVGVGQALKPGACPEFIPKTDFEVPPVSDDEGLGKLRHLPFFSGEGTVLRSYITTRREQRRHSYYNWLKITDKITTIISTTSRPWITPAILLILKPLNLSFHA